MCAGSGNRRGDKNGRVVVILVGVSVCALATFNNFKLVCSWRPPITIWGVTIVSIGITLSSWYYELSIVTVHLLHYFCFQSFYYKGRVFIDPRLRGMEKRKWTCFWVIGADWRTTLFVGACHDRCYLCRCCPSCTLRETLFYSASVLFLCISPVCLGSELFYGLVSMYMLLRTQCSWLTVLIVVCLFNICIWEGRCH